MPRMPHRSNTRAQAFLKVYATLREEILDDALLQGQPSDAKEWMREVGRGVAVCSGLSKVVEHL